MDPQQYLVLLNQLHLSQSHLLAVIERIMEECIPTQRHSRDYLVKFPEELLVDNLGNHMLFAAECLLAGTFMELEEPDGVQLRPQARKLLCSLELVRTVLREQSLSQPSSYSEAVRAVLVQFDRLFAEFELSYVSSLVAVKSPEEIYRQQEIIVLFCETVERALRLGYLTQEMIDGYEPLLMFTIPRLAIISGLLIYPEGPLSLEQSPEQMSRVFSPFYNLLKKIRDLLRVLSVDELALLERSLCTAELQDPCTPAAAPAWGAPATKPPSARRGRETWARTGTCGMRGAAAAGAGYQDIRSASTSGRARCPARCPTIASSPSSSPRPQPGALQGARCSELRSRYGSTRDMLHTLFVCISGVADQLQTNFASDLRSILKTVFKIVASQPEPEEEPGSSQEEGGEARTTATSRLAECPLCSSTTETAGLCRAGVRRLPEWVPDSSCSQCSACRAPFTLLRRRHHCRSCGKIFCARCSPHTAALPHFGQPRPVRVCTHCYAVHR
ncbi:lateral signaling target protein 2 homolog [Nothoprocta perdicaria]|uniref:lateral signaling target protein 2 homolog n=1 Tax=Nothoprocta perdicaria TaxID=30464 RepID=UPI000E1BCD4C|nr:lateral signaling target protein 2 homolog [Nothoprocta perdicaria]